MGVQQGHPHQRQDRDLDSGGDSSCSVVMSAIYPVHAQVPGLDAGEDRRDLLLGAEAEVPHSSTAASLGSLGVCEPGQLVLQW